jgi:hypothetical protein
MSIENEYMTSPETAADVHFEQALRLAVCQHWLSWVTQRRLDIEKMYITGRLSTGELDYAQDYYDDRIRGYAAAVDAYEAALARQNPEQN